MYLNSSYEMPLPQGSISAAMRCMTCKYSSWYAFAGRLQALFAKYKNPRTCCVTVHIDYLTDLMGREQMLRGGLPSSAVSLRMFRLPFKHERVADRQVEFVVVCQRCYCVPPICKQPEPLSEVAGTKQIITCLHRFSAEGHKGEMYGVSSQNVPSQSQVAKAQAVLVSSEARGWKILWSCTKSEKRSTPLPSGLHNSTIREAKGLLFNSGEFTKSCTIDSINLVVDVAKVVQTVNSMEKVK